MQTGDMNHDLRSVEHHELQEELNIRKIEKDEIQDPGEKPILRRVRHNSINSGTPNFSYDPDGPAQIDSETLTETHGSHEDNEESSNSRCHTRLKDATLSVSPRDDMEELRVMLSLHCMIFNAVESLLFSLYTSLWGEAPFPRHTTSAYDCCITPPSGSRTEHYAP